MRFVGLILIFALLFNGAAAAAHGYGAFPDQKTASRAMHMPCCPPADHQKADGMACHYCCAMTIAVLPVSRPPVPFFSATFPAAGERRMAGFLNHDLFRPPRSFL